MSPLGFADLFNMAKESAAHRELAQTTQPATSYANPVHAMMNAKYCRDQFIRVFRDTGRHLRRWDVFQDFITLAANELDIARIRSPENIERSRKICGRYDAADLENMQMLFSLMVSALEAKFHDFLGTVFMELELGSGDMGQYFTPYCVQYLMAKMLLPGTLNAIRREGIVTVSDPASGAGGMLIAYAECLLGADINPSMLMFAHCTDIDPIAADMTFIQLSLLGIGGEVVTGNTLTLQCSRIRYTPVYYFNHFEERLNSQRRILAMRDFIRGMSIAA